MAVLYNLKNKFCKTNKNFQKCRYSQESKNSLFTKRNISQDTQKCIDINPFSVMLKFEIKKNYSLTSVKNFRVIF